MSDPIARLNATLGGRYAIERELGEGGMATVYLAEDLKHRRPVAIKVMKPELAHALGAERFLREIEIAASLAHPNILPLLDSGEADGLLFFVMPYVQGDTLRDRLRRDGPFPLDEAIRITSEVADALDYAHTQGLIHRDIKPANILFQVGHAVVSDFGIARGIAESGGTRLTETGLAVGTIAYMSPEQAVGDADLDARTDVYALGCVLYEMLEGGTPFGGRTPQAVLAKKVTGAVPEFSADTSVPATVAAVVRKALAAAPEGRYATPSDFAGDLKTAITVEAIEAASARRRSARWLRVLGVVAGVALLAFGGLWIMTSLSGPSIERVAVLPPENDRNDPTQDFFIDGMHDALITEMGQAGISVIGRRSVMRYRDDVTPVRDIARELNVDAVIESFAFREGDSVGIRLRLVDGITEASLWSESFGTEAHDVIQLYRQVTGAIAREIDLTLSSEVIERLASAPPVDPDAYEAYLNGMYHTDRFTPEDLGLAEQYFEQALEIDPDYALAHKGIAFLWAARQQFGLASPAEAQPNVRAAAQRALEADSTIAEAQFALAVLRMTEWDWAGAEQAFRRAIELNPNYAEVRAFYSHLLVFLSRPEEALEQADLAVAMDPLNSKIGAMSCVTLSHGGRNEEAVARCEETLRRDPTQPVAHGALVTALRNLGRHEEAQAARIARIRSRGDHELARELEQAYDEGGFERVGALRAEMLVAQSKVRFVPPTNIARNFAGAGEAEKALDWLERGFQLHDSQMLYSVVERWPEEVQTHPRFREIRRRMGLSERD